MRAAIFILFLVTTPLFSQITKEAVTYSDGTVTCKGYLVYDASAKGALPGVLVVHEWWGLNTYAKHRAEMLAELGYVALAVDMYGDGTVATTPQDAGKLAGAVKGNPQLMRKRINAALAYLKTLKQVNTAKTAAIGYCFGGTVALELARSGAAVNGVVSFHGALATKEPATEPFTAKVLVCHGAADPFVPDTEVAAFTAEMNNVKADWQFNAYSYAVHAFTNPQSGSDPSRGAAYNEKADTRSWAAMQVFFNELFK